MKHAGPKLPLIVLMIFAAAALTWLGLRPVKVFPFDESGLVIKPIIQLGFDTPPAPAIVPSKMPAKPPDAPPVPDHLSIAWGVRPDPEGSKATTKWQCLYTANDGEWHQAQTTSIQHIAYSP